MVTAGIARYMAIECGTPQQQIPTSKIDTSIPTDYSTNTMGRHQGST
jgi:hypothetical protein